MLTHNKSTLVAVTTLLIAWTGCIYSNVYPWLCVVFLYSTQCHDVFQTGLSKS